MFPGSANPSDLSPGPAQSPPPTLPPNPDCAESAGVLVTLLFYAKKRLKLARSALSSITAPPSDVGTKAVRKVALRSLSWDAATPRPPSVATVVVSTPLSMAPLPSALQSSPLSVLLGTKTFPMADPGGPQTTPQGPTVHPMVPATPSRQGPRFTPAGESSNLKPLIWFAACPPNIGTPLPPAETSLMLAAPSSELAPVQTGASPRRPTSRWIFRCRQAQPQHRVLHHPNHSIILVV